MGTEEVMPVKEKEVITDFSLIERAEAAAKRMEEANIRSAELLARQEAILSRQIMSGRSEAGIPPKPNVVLSDIEYANKFFKGEINPFKDA